MSWDDGDWDDGYWDDLLPPDAATVTARRFWLSLPQFIRTADELLEYPLLDYVSLWTDQIDVVQTVVDDIAAGHLTNPTEADAAWLTWLCSAVGITIQPWWTEATIRARLGDTATYYAHGTPNAIEAAVADVYSAGGGVPFVWDDTLVWSDSLIWTGAAEIVRHWRGNIWHVIIRTTLGTTPLTGTYITTMGELEASFPTFADLVESVPTFADLVTIDRVRLDVVAAALPEEPSGVRLYSVIT